MAVASYRFPLALVAFALCGCRPISVILDCPPSVEVGAEFDVVVSLEKSGGDTDFDVAWSWSSPNPFLAGIVYVAVDGDPLDPPEESFYLDLTAVPEGDLSITAVGEPCPEGSTTCWGTLNVEGKALKSGLFGSDHDSDACEIDYTEPAGP